uniref:CoA-transferase family III n=1 Tax=Aquipseudomonas alcaligenes TaxID=43263 RepID=Q9F133_AQUAC|nr:hypothetical protein [Pseudomonas alcaligenes]
MNAALGALVALHERERSGLGQVVDASIFESVLGVMESIIPDYVKASYIRERAGSILPGIAPSNAYQCKDRRDVIIGANQDSVFSRLCEAMGQKELADDLKFSNHRSRGENQRELDEIINKWTLRHDSSFVIDCLVEKGVPVGLIYNAKDMVDDPHFKARESIVEVNNEKGSPIPMQNVFPRLSRTPGKIKNVGPGLGEHNDEVLKTWLGSIPKF